METYNNEIVIIEHFQSLDTKSIILIPENAESIVELVHDKNKWKAWKDSSGKSDPPPDFYSEKYKLMLDVMRIDDHAYISSKGQVVNPTLACEGKLMKEFERSNFAKMFPNVNVFFEVNTGLPTDQDHNYKYYIDNFKRVVENHKRKIKQYRENHPGYKTIFFIFDESSAYFETDAVNLVIDKAYLGRPHQWYLDEELVKVFENSDIDYVVWFAPFKLMKSEDQVIDLPRAAIFDTKAIDLDTIRYCLTKMKSNEL